MASANVISVHMSAHPRQKRDNMSRKNYHHGDLRNALIEAALRLIEREGAHDFSMREAAKEAGVAASAPYRHFEDKTALMVAVAEVALAELRQRMRDAMTGEEVAGQPLEQYRAAGIAYVLFAYERPAHFRVLHDTKYGDPARSEKLASYHQENVSDIAEKLARADEHGMFDREFSHELIEFAASTIMYGLARRIIDGHIPEEVLSKEGVEALANQLGELLASGFLQKPTA